MAVDVPPRSKYQYGYFQGSPQLEVQHVHRASNGAGVTTLDILYAADWSTETTFQRFYHRDMQDRSIFGSAILASVSTFKLTC